MYHAKRLAFFGTVLVCTVLLTACPSVGVNPIAPGYMLMLLPQSVFEPCTTDFVLRLSADGVLVYDNKMEDQSLLAPVRGVQRRFYRIPQAMRTGASLRIDIECYGANQALIEVFTYEAAIRYPVFRESGARFSVEPLSASDPLENCIDSDTENAQNETQLCVRTNLFSEL